ncbi:MAG: hypothetical protein IVW56_03380 [Candidatus Binataceae bacterium]|nr:hypothetical protein [Candidatus Binataceae bacterium]
MASLAAGLTIGLAMSGEAIGLATSEAIGEASGDEASSDFVQAAAAKIIEKRAKMKIFRISVS